MPSLKSLSLCFLALLGCCALFPGCSTPPKVGIINVTLVGFRPVENPNDLNHAIMTIRFTSEDVHAAGFSGSTHLVYLNGEYLGKAENTVPIGLPPQGSQTLDVILELEHPGLVRRAVGVSDQARYRLDSELRYTDNGDQIRLKAHDEGKIPVAGLELAAR